MKLKVRCFAIMFACAIIFTGCASSGGTTYKSADFALNSAADSGLGYDSNYAYDSTGYTETEDYINESSSMDNNMDTLDKELQEPEAEQEEINKDMLIYRGSVNITTKEFDSDITFLKSTLAAYDCFFESERQWSDKMYDDRVISYYSATVRVPSSSYNDLLNGLSKVGTVTNLSSNCENVSAEYSDTIVAIDIYEAERERYVNLLKTITDDYYAIEVQRELTDIELKLAQFRARKQNIETDVAYSYVDINLEEVREYVQQTEYNDNFFKRLWDTIVNTLFGFLTFLEELLFAIIRILPYIFLIWIIYKIFKKLGIWRRLGRIRPIKFVRDKITEYKLERELAKQRNKEKREAINAVNRMRRADSGDSTSNTVYMNSQEGNDNGDGSNISGS